MRIVDVVGLVVIAAIGATFLDLGLELRSDQSPYGDGIVTTASTTSFRASRHLNRRRTYWTVDYHAVYTFRTSGGESVEYADPIAVSSPPRLGRTVEISYRANEPAKARIVRGRDGWTAYAIVFAAIGILVFAVDACVLGRGLGLGREDRTSKTGVGDQK